MATASTRPDALANRTALLDAAERVLASQGAGVPLDTIAREAGVGIATLYRNFADRGELLAAVTHRAYELIARFATDAERSPAAPLEAIKQFLLHVIEQRDHLVLPLLGGPQPQADRIDPLAGGITASLTAVLGRGVADGSIRSDAVATDIIVAGAMLAHAQLPHPTWRHAATRQAYLFLDGLRARNGASALPGPLTRHQLNEAMVARR